MIRTRTTFVVGAGASCELQLPSGTELVTKIATSLDFDRYGAELQTRDSALLLQYLGKLASRSNNGEVAMRAAALRLRTAAKLGGSIDSILEQHNDDQMVLNCGKLAIAHFICQAEAKSTLRLTARLEGDLPMQGADNWLYHLARLITADVPRRQAERCLDELAIISFNYDRSIEHFLPHAFVMAFGMPLTEAQRLIAAKLNLIRPYGAIGRLPWFPGEGPDNEWGTEMPLNMLNLAPQIKTLSERQNDRQLIMRLQNSVATAKRLIVLGFGFQPQNIDLLFDRGLSHQPEVLMSLFDMSPTNRNAVIKTMKRKTGLERDDQMMVMTARCFEVMRDYSMLIES